MPNNHSATDPAPSSPWRGYYDVAGLRPPRPTLLRALEGLAQEGITSGRAVDLGCGVGRDTLELLRWGWQVTAVDSEPEALARLAAEAQARGLPAPELVVATFEAASIPTCNLVNSSFALFFCDPAAFPKLWQRIRRALVPGGRFAGQLLGPADSWAQRSGVTIHDRAELSAVLAGYAVEWLEREQADTVTPRGEAKRWDIWHLVLRCPDGARGGTNHAC
jgi:SAM-dependent methyltransferase